MMWMLNYLRLFGISFTQVEHVIVEAQATINEFKTPSNASQDVTGA